MKPVQKQILYLEQGNGSIIPFFAIHPPTSPSSTFVNNSLSQHPNLPFHIHPTIRPFFHLQSAHNRQPISLCPPTSTTYTVRNHFRSESSFLPPLPSTMLINLCCNHFHHHPPLCQPLPPPHLYRSSIPNATISIVSRT